MEEIRSKINIMMCELNEMKDNLLFVMGELNDLKKEQETEDTINDEWILDIGEKYYYINLDDMCTDYVWWNNEQIDNARLKHQVIFKTKKETSEYLEYLLEKEKHMNTFTEEEWEDIEIKKWHYQYDCEDKIISYDYANLFKKNIPYFKTKEEVLDFIKKYEWQIKHELGVK